MKLSLNRTKNEKAQLCWDQLVIELGRHNRGPDTCVSESWKQVQLENEKSLKKEIGWPANEEEEVEDEQLEVGHVEEILPGKNNELGKSSEKGRQLRSNKTSTNGWKKERTKYGEAAATLFIIPIRIHWFPTAAGHLEEVRFRGGNVQCSGLASSIEPVWCLVCPTDLRAHAPFCSAVCCVWWSSRCWCRMSRQIEVFLHECAPSSWRTVASSA